MGGISGGGGSRHRVGKGAQRYLVLAHGVARLCPPYSATLARSGFSSISASAINDIVMQAATVKNTWANARAASVACGGAAPPNAPGASIVAVAASTMTPSRATSIVVNRLREKFIVPTAMPS